MKFRCTWDDGSWDEVSLSKHLAACYRDIHSLERLAEETTDTIEQAKLLVLAERIRQRVDEMVETLGRMTDERLRHKAARVRAAHNTNRSARPKRYSFGQLRAVYVAARAVFQEQGNRWPTRHIDETIRERCGVEQYLLSDERLDAIRRRIDGRPARRKRKKSG